MGPELDLYIANLLNRPLHLAEESLKLNHVRKLRVDIPVLEVVALNKFLNNALVAEYGELLLQARLLLLSHVQLDKGGMDVPHHLELVEREGNVDAWTVHEFDQRVLIEPHDEMLQENLILVRRLYFTDPLPICYNIEKFVFLLARALQVLAFRDMRVNQPNHCGPVLRVLIHAVGEIAHAVNLN